MRERERRFEDLVRLQPGVLANLVIEREERIRELEKAARASSLALMAVVEK